MKKFTLQFLLLILSFSLKAQVSGSTTVCVGYLYDYSVNVPNASTYNWTTPFGWLLLSGQNTNQIHILANYSVGNVCVDAFDEGGTLISTQCLNVAWGGGSTGWDAVEQIHQICFCNVSTLSVTPNSSTCPGTCGSGVPSANTYFAVYDGPWGSGNYLGPADGTTPYAAPQTPPGSMLTVYIYMIDTSQGVNNPVLLSGGNCPIISNNMITLQGCFPPTLSFQQTPDPACYGDTITVTYTNSISGANSFSWSSFDPGLTLVSPGNTTNVNVVVNQAIMPGSLNLSLNDNMGCLIEGSYSVDASNCSGPTPIANFTSSSSDVCRGQCLSFTNLSQNSTSYEWTFQGGTPSASTDVNPSSICYLTSGTYDVQLIATGANGSDTLLLADYVTVLTPVTPTLTFSNDTIYTSSGFHSFVWHWNGNIISGAHQSYYVATQDGDYSVHCLDSNGCSTTATMIGVVTGITEEQIQDLYIYPNPADQTLSFTNSSQKNEITGATLFNSSGAIVKSKTDMIGKNEFNVANLANGIYLLKIETQQGSLKRKVNVMHQ